MSEDYERLLSKVDSVTSSVATRRASDLACRAGCAGCCHVELSVAHVEAESVARLLATLAEDVRAEIRSRAGAAPDGRCVMLDREDRCSVHPARPLVCRTQGLPLLYPEGFVPIDAIRMRTTRGDVTVCPLNFVAAEPMPDDLIDAARIDTMLALVDRLDAEARARAPMTRVALRDVALGRFAPEGR